jgi:hypothetical protein
MTGIRPSVDFEWSAVGWGAPDQARADTCSYCDAPVGEHDCLLMLFNDLGWCAQFCDPCAERYFGMQST